MAKLKRAPLWDATRPTIEEEDDDNTQEAPTTAKLKKIGRTWVIIIEHADGTRNDYRFTTKAKATRWAWLAGLELEEVADQREAPNRVYYAGRPAYYEGFGEKHTVAQWVKLLNLPRTSLWRYLNDGLTIEEVARIRKVKYPTK